MHQPIVEVLNTVIILVFKTNKINVLFIVSGKPLQLLLKYIAHLNNTSLCRTDIGL